MFLTLDVSLDDRKDEKAGLQRESKKIRREEWKTNEGSQRERGGLKRRGSWVF